MPNITPTPLPFTNDVVLYRNVPLYPDYKDTVYFNTEAQRNTWFNQYVQESFRNQQYQRVASNRIRLQGYVEDYRAFNYGRIWNYRNATNQDMPSYFYFFVIDMEYINDNTFEILYEIDVMVTYCFSYTLLTCYVEREHAESDNVGEHLLAEPITVGDHIIQDVTEPNPTLTTNRIILAYLPPNWIPSNPTGRVVIVGSARTNENGEDTGGEAGDQTGHECETQVWYNHSLGWDLLRANDSVKARRIAYAMQSICDNDNIGYDFNLASPNLLSVSAQYNYDPAQVVTPCNTNCSQAVQVCCLYAGISVGSFYTGNEYSTLMATGEFTGYTSSDYTSNPDNMQVGDILVTKSQGHTVVVVSIANQ